MYKLVAFMIIVYLVFLAGAGWWVSKELAPLTKTHPDCVSELSA
jgi:hypothetical protein